MGQIVEKIGEFEFRINAEADDQGGLLWDEAVEKRYNAWLNDLFRKKKEVFTIQKIVLPPVVLDVIDAVIGDNPGSDRSGVIRAMLRVFLDRIETDSTLKNDVEKRYGDKSFQDLLSIENGVEVVKVRFTPKGFVSVKAQADLFDMKPKEVVEQAVYRVSACLFQGHGKKVNEELQSYLAA